MSNLKDLMFGDLRDTTTGGFIAWMIIAASFLTGLIIAAGWITIQLGNIIWG